MANIRNYGFEKIDARIHVSETSLSVMTECYDCSRRTQAVLSHFTVLAQHGLLAEWQQLTTGTTHNCNKSSLKQHVIAMFKNLHGSSHGYTSHITTVTSPAYRATSGHN